MPIPTPHISAGKEDFARTVLMPGDPMRSKFIAEKYLTDAKLINNIRGVQGYTGTYKGKRVSVMASGMGMPAIGIYSYELFNFYDVDNIIRIGTAGAISPDLKLRDIVMGIGCCTDTNFAHQYKLPGTYAPIASFDLLLKAHDAAKRLGIELKAGNLLSSDIFYDDTDNLAAWRKMNVLAVEMEAAALYMNAARAGKNALCICTVSDLPLSGGAKCTVEERETSFTQMMEIALEIA